MYKAIQTRYGWRVIYTDLDCVVAIFTGFVRDARSAAEDYAAWCNRQAAIDV